MTARRLTLEDAMRLHGMTEPPKEEWVRGFLIESTEKLVERYGEEWVIENRARLREEIEFIANM